jgi:hypothetical protein
MPTRSGRKINAKIAEIIRESEQPVDVLAKRYNLGIYHIVNIKENRCWNPGKIKE